MIPFDDEWQKHGGPAFPTTRELGDGSSIVTSGMTLRDYFAAKAMSAMACADADNGRFRDGHERTAQFAYDMADAMLAERAK